MYTLSYFSGIFTLAWKEERGKRKEERGKRKEERGKRKEERRKRKEEKGKRKKVLSVTKHGFVF